MAKTFEAPALPAAIAAFMMTWCGATAEADAQTPPNIPASEHKNDAAEQTELPLPYESWRGSGHLPPAPAEAHDLPLPLARARELPRRPLELAAAFTALLPSCGPGSVDDRGCRSVQASGGLDLTALYRVTPFFGLGLAGVVSGFGNSSSQARFGGVTGRVYFADSGAWDPYLALTLGAGKLTLSENEDSGATSGLGGRVAGGIDYLLGSRLRVGPSASYAHWVAWSEQRCERGTCREQPLAYGRLLGFATLSVSVTGSFGEVL